MAGWLTVLVDNKDLIRFSRLNEGESGTIDLTTMLPDQDRVAVEIHMANGGTRSHVYTFRASGIKRSIHRPKIVLSAHVRGEATVALRIDGELIESYSFNVPRVMVRRTVAPFVVTAALAVLLIGLGWGAWTLAASGAGPLIRTRAAASNVLGGSRSPNETANLPAARINPARAADSPTDSTAASEAPATATWTPAADVVQTQSGGATEADAGDASSDSQAAEAISVAPLSLDATLYFEPESALLTGDTKSAIDRIAQSINEWLGTDGATASVAVTISGHTALYDSEESRLELSRERARAVGSYLTARLGSDRADSVAISAIGRGGSEPVTREESLQWENRRAVLRVSSTSTAP